MASRSVATIRPRRASRRSRRCCARPGSRSTKASPSSRPCSPCRFPLGIRRSSSLSAEAQRRKTLEALAAWLFAIGEERPVVMLIEDLHWIDPSSLELLEALVEQVPTARVFMVVTHRPGVDVSWATQSHVVHLALHPLTQKQVAAIVDRVTGGKPLPRVVLDQVVAKTDGVPLFVEELTKAILESDLLVEQDRQFERADPLPGSAIPATLQDSLMARLDRLGPAKEVAQLASVIGREFPHDLLAAVAPHDPVALSAALEELAGAELVHRRGTPPRAVYTFKHALVQEAAYQSLLKKKCQKYHARIARTLEQRFPERVGVGPEVAAPPLRGSGRRRPSDSVVRAGGRARGPAIGAPRGDQPPPPRTRAPRDDAAVSRP